MVWIKEDNNVGLASAISRPEYYRKFMGTFAQESAKKQKKYYVVNPAERCSKRRMGQLASRTNTSSLRNDTQPCKSNQGNEGIFNKILRINLTKIV